MKILYTNFHPRNGGGHATYVANLVRALRSAHDITVATPATSRLFAQVSALSGVRCVDARFSTRAGSMAGEVVALRALMRAQAFDIVHVNGSADHRQAMIARLGLRPRIPIVWTKHNTYRVDSFGNRLRARFGTDAAIGVCDHVSALLRDSAYRRCLVTTVRLGVDTHWFSPQPEAAVAHARTELFGHLPDDSRVLGSVAGTDHDKGWMTLVRAVARLAPAQRARVRLLIAGDPPREAQQAEVAALGMDEYTVFPGLVSDPRRILAASDAGFVLSFHEAGSYAACESLSMGLPTLVSDAGGLPELVRDGVDGWIVPAGDEDAVLAWLRAWLQAPVDRALAKAARARALACFSMDGFADRTLSVYRQVRSVGLPADGERT